MQEKNFLLSSYFFHLQKSHQLAFKPIFMSSRSNLNTHQLDSSQSSPTSNSLIDGRFAKKTLPQKKILNKIIFAKKMKTKSDDDDKEEK